MRELALNILDLVQNSIEAAALKILLEVEEDHSKDLLITRVSDNVRGMNQEMVYKARDPFITTRNTRQVGLGIPLVDMTTRKTGGYLKIYAHPENGTVLEAAYTLSHLDRPPLGNMLEKVKSIIAANPELDVYYCYMVDTKTFKIEIKELVKILESISFTQPTVLDWLTEYLKIGIANLYRGVV